MNKNLLKSVMMAHGHLNEDLAKLLGITTASVSAKMNENGTEFKQGEIAKIKDAYNLTPEEVDSIFFS